MRRIPRFVTFGATMLAVVLLLVQSVPAGPLRPLFFWEFTEAAPQGFGDRQNTGTWSMQWWDGKLYVGTVRAWYCWSRAWLEGAFPGLPWPPYPPRDPDLECAADPRELPLRAEIWRYTPETKTWERVYQSPDDMEIPGSPGWYTARDVGYRGMAVFQEPDGTEALYVGGVTSYLLWPPTPPPRILRSTDGVTFQAIPQDPGTLLGDLGQDQTSFRSMEVYKGRLYVINGQVHGEGGVLEAENPAGGNDNFRWITPQGMEVFELAVYNGYLYLGLLDRTNGYALVKTDATGTVPYTFTPVVTHGAYRPGRPSPTALSMFVFKDRLYVGTDDPTEIIRINPDDTWELIVGTPRETPAGWKYPLSGMDTGFDWVFNQHMWRMQEHEGVLYVGTMDMSTRWRNVPGMDEWIGDRYGFDLYATEDGQHFRAVTMNAFGDKFQNGLRTLASTPHGLFVGSVSFWYGMRVWDGVHGEVHNFYLPLLMNSTESTAVIQRPGEGSLAGPEFGHCAPSLSAVQRLAAETRNDGVVLSWELPCGATRFRIFRSEFASHRTLRLSHLAADTWIPGPFVEVGTSDRFFYVDRTTRPDGQYQYYVVAEDDRGRVSPASDLARSPSLAPAVTLDRAIGALDDWLGPSGERSRRAAGLALALQAVRDDLAAGDMAQVVGGLAQLSDSLAPGELGGLEPWRAEDMRVLLAELRLRAHLAQAGIIASSELE